MSDFHVTVSDAYGGEQTILIWGPLAILAYNVVMENGGSKKAAQKASSAVIHHGKVIDYEQKLTVRRQVIMSARKAADAVIEELGNGDVATAVLEAVRVGGEILISAKASGIVIDALATQDPEADPGGGNNNCASSNLIHISFSKPMGIVFEPIGDPQECGVRIRDLPPSGKAFLSEELKAGDELLSINDTKMSNLTFYEILDFISDEDEKKQFHLILQRPNKREMKATMGRKFRSLIKKREMSSQVEPNKIKISSSKGNLDEERRDDSAPSREVNAITSPAPLKTENSKETLFSFFRLLSS